MPAPPARLCATAVLMAGLAWISCGRARTGAPPSVARAVPPGPVAEPARPAVETLDRFQFGGSEPTMASRIVVDGQGHCFYGCYVGATVYTQWVVRRSADGGRTWSTCDNFSTGPGRWNYVTGLACDADGAVFVSGVSEVDGAVTGVVRKSTDHGATWTTSAQVRMPGSSGCKTYNVTSLGGGLVFALGRCAGGVLHWLVRRSTDAGATWSDVDYPHATQTYASKVFDVARARNGDLVAFGYLDGPAKEAWLFRRSRDDGATWADLSRVHTQDGFTDVVGGLLSTSGGALLAAGWTIDPAGPIRAILRRSEDSGATWSTVDDYRLGGARTLYQALAQDSRGRLFALATQAVDPGGEATPAYGMLRVSTDDGRTWGDYLELRGEGGIGALYSGLCIDRSDHLFLCGQHGAHAVVQRVRLPSR